ncbi:MAG: [FeFe] hydrogenase H-cluster radical SAM maturase HydE [Peptoniphilaceae bacterium]|nr:[FeFe] hydrogenase H-cluster radical SAM maturase HydE [Peptoniphilaceae bacterium]
MQKKTEYFTDDQLRYILKTDDSIFIEDLKKKARDITKSVFSNKIYIRGLVEISNYCKQGCYYCGLNRENKNIKRYRLSKEDIIKSCDFGYSIGFRTFVFQGGEDPIQDDDFFTDLISEVKKRHSDCAITLSLGIRSKKSYQKLKNAGADRYLLRHESAQESVFNKLHPNDQSLKSRIESIKYLKEIGFQTGTGFMVQAPFSSIESHIKDIKLIRNLKPQMIGIGPFIPNKNTKFKNENHGESEITTRLLAILRIENPFSLIPSTTALNSIDDEGRIKGILSGANVVMPNLSPKMAKENYNLYDNKKSSGLESANALKELNDYFKKYGYEIEISRGDYLGE